MKVLAILAGVIGTLLAGEALAADSGVVLLYHKFGEDNSPSTSVSMALKIDEKVVPL